MESSSVSRLTGASGAGAEGGANFGSGAFATHAMIPAHGAGDGGPVPGVAGTKLGGSLGGSDGGGIGALYPAEVQFW